MQRLMKPVLFGWLCVLLLLPAVAEAASIKQPDIREFTLENGLKLVVIPDRRAPVVTHTIWYKAGSADDPPGKSGLVATSAGNMRAPAL